MFTTNLAFSLLASGARMRVLVAPVNEHTDEAGTAQALLTTDPDNADALVRALRRFADARWTLLLTWVTDHPGVRCELRRAVGDLLAAGADPDVVAHGPMFALAPLLEAAGKVDGASRTAIHQLVLSMLDGCDDIPVRVRLEPEHLEDDATVYANQWLTREATDEDVAALLAEDSDVIHDSLQWTLREQHPFLEEWMEETWVHITADLHDVRAWVSMHRPHLLA